MGYDDMIVGGKRKRESTRNILRNRLTVVITTDTNRIDLINYSTKKEQRHTERIAQSSG